MKIIENVHKLDKNRVIIFKYPIWMKWFIKFIDIYYIPDIKNNSGFGMRKTGLDFIVPYFKTQVKMRDLV